MGDIPIISTQILRILADCGCVSRQVFDMLPFHKKSISRQLTPMVEKELVIKSGKRNNYQYKILLKGRNILATVNPKRFSEHAFITNNSLYKSPLRAQAKGDTLALMLFAGFNIHQDDKPPLPLSPNIQPQQNPNTPDFWTRVYQNKVGHVYRGYDCIDTTTYVKRNTPLNCYYDSVEIKQNIAEMYNSNIPNKGVGFSRICGVLPTPDYLFRVMYSLEKSLKIKAIGESSLKKFSSDIFKGFVAKEKNAVIIIGDGRFKTAMRILDNSLNRKRLEFAVKQTSKGILLNANNFGKPLFYFPILPAALPLLSIMKYPNWRFSLMRQAASELFDEIEVLSDNAIYFCFGNHVRCFMGLDLNLTALAQMIENAAYHTENPIYIVCADWQSEFYESVLKTYNPHNLPPMRLAILQVDFFTRMEKYLEEYWE